MSSEVRQRLETRPRTEPSGSFSPLRSHPFHSQLEQEVNETGDPPSVISTLSVSVEQQDGHGVDLLDSRVGIAVDLSA
jgi:hypothetical protein